MEIQTERSLSITHLADHHAECVKTVHLLEKNAKIYGRIWGTMTISVAIQL